MDKIVLGGLPIVRVTRASFAEQMLRDCRHRSRSAAKVSFSANGFSIAMANRDPTYANMLSQADYIDADGMPLVIASKLKYSIPLPERIATTDFFHDAANVAQENGLSFYFLGGSEENGRRLMLKIKSDYPNLIISGRHHGYYSTDEESIIFDGIASSNPDVVWIGMGSPRQEGAALRLQKHARNIGWIKTCGGLFDHILELQPRAPSWMQMVGMEWLHRMAREPRRLAWRYLWSNPTALFYLQTKSSPDRNIF